MKKPILTAFVCLFMLSITSRAQVSGTVFKDFNFNGTQQTSGFPTEPGVYGVQVKAFNAGGIQLGTTKITTLAGAYSFSAAEIPSGTAIRLEFSSPSGSFDSKVAAGGNGSSIQFLAAPSTTANYAVSSRQWYSNTANPYVATNTSTNGNPLGGGTAGTNSNLYVFPYDMGNGTANDGGATRRLPNSQLGSVYGLASQKTTRTVFMAAYLKRHAGFGPNGIGAIYKSVIPTTGVPAAATLLVDVTTIGINVGTDPHSAGALPAASVTRNADPGVFGEIGKRGIGGIAVSEDGGSLYLVNMFQKKLQRINIGNPVKASFTAADVTGSWLMPDPATTGMVWHPMACKVANGKVYVGGVVVFEKTTNHNLATDSAGARGIVYEFDTAAATFTEVLRFPFNYRRGFSNADFRYPEKNNWWCAWQNNGNGGATDPLTADYNTAGAGAISGGIYYPQPMLADIEFDVTGEMIIGIRDRFGDQMGYQNLSNDGLPTGTGFGAANNYYRALSSGEVLRAGKNAGANSYTMESLGSVNNNFAVTTSAGVASGNPATTSGNWTTGANMPWGGNYGPGWNGVAGTIPPGGPNPGTAGAYFYFNHNYTTAGTPANLNGTAGSAINGHYFKSDGSVALLAGSGEVVHTMMDPVNTSYTQGVGKMYNSGAQAGNMSQRLQLTVTAAGDPSNMGKAGGMCDLEILTDYQPVEIGNRVWNDINGNGIQDAGEAGIAGVAIQLTSPGPDGLPGTADDIIMAGTTTSASGEFYFNALTIADTRKPASFIGVGALDILPGFAYQIRIDPAQAALAGYRLSPTDASGNTQDNIDNDAGIMNGYAAADVNTSVTNHTIDFGFRKLASLGDKVWLDNGAGGGTAGDGTQNGTEPGVANVAVMLYRNGPDGLPATNDDVLIGATTTDAYGNYAFENLAPADQTDATTIGQTSYNVRITPPANYIFTAQTNTTDDNNTTGISVTGSDVNSLGASYSINLSNGETNMNIDAGLVFKTVTGPASIGDQVWFDKDGNGNYDTSEPGVSDITVSLLDVTGNIIAATTTDANGNYLFNNLPTGTYKVSFNAPGGTVLTTSTGTTPGNGTTNSDPNPSTGITTSIVISAAGTQITGIDAGIKNDPKGAIGDFVWNDINHNGIQDPGEPGIPGISVKLYGTGPDGVIGGGDDISIGSTTTNINGYYIFNNLDPAKYFILVTPPSGYTLTLADVTAGNPGGDAKDNDFAAAGAPYAGKFISPLKTLLPIAGGVTRDMTVDIGFYNSTANLNSLGDFVWNDANRNGIQDAGEAGVSNITVRLLNSSGIAVNNPASGKPYIISTDTIGKYKFFDLADGNYILEFANLPAGYSFTKTDAAGSGAPGSGTDAATDNDASTTTGRTAVIDLDAAASIPTSLNIVTVDAGLRQGTDTGTASMGNRVWYDMNNNGVQDAGELGVANVQAELLDGTGAQIDTDPAAAGIQPYVVHTNALGEYLFTGLDAGDYKVKFSRLPAGYTSSAIHQGTDDLKDADANFSGTSVTVSTVAVTAAYTLQTGEDNMSVDMGIVPAAGTNSTGDLVWNDINLNGIQDAGEPGVQGVNVSLYTNGADGIPATADDILVAVTATDSLGRYAFVGLADGNYNAAFSNLPAGFKFTTQNAAGSTAANGSDANTAGGRTGTIALDPASVTAASVINNDIDAGIITTRAAIGNFVWLDTNGDGLQNTTEPGIAGVTVTLYASDAVTVVAGTVTDASGKYYFNNLNPGTFVVGFGTTPSGLSFTTQITPGDNGNNSNSDADPVTGKSAPVVLSAGETDLTIDAGIKPDNFASVGDLVWNDVNANGIQDPNEPGVPGIIATLFDGLNNVIGTAITDGNGKYLISKIPAGSYYIGFSNLPGIASYTSQTSNVTPADATLGSDANTTTGKTVMFTLVGGQYLPTVDAGLKQILVLPVKIVSFTALPDNGKVKLQWAVAGQQDIANYEAEFSANGIDFSDIASVKANTNLSAIYNAYHMSPLPGINYYRIRITDLSGRISYTEIRKVNFGKRSEVSIYPNPARRFVNVTLAGSMIGASATISIFSADGKLLLQKQLAAAGQTETLDVSKLPNGNYIIRTDVAGQTTNNIIEVIR